MCCSAHLLPIFFHVQLKLVSSLLFIFLIRCKCAHLSLFVNSVSVCRDLSNTHKGCEKWKHVSYIGRDAFQIIFLKIILQSTALLCWPQVSLLQRDEFLHSNDIFKRIWNYQRTKLKCIAKSAYYQLRYICAVLFLLKTTFSTSKLQSNSSITGFLN